MKQFKITAYHQKFTLEADTLSKARAMFITEEVRRSGKCVTQIGRNIETISEIYPPSE